MSQVRPKKHLGQHFLHDREIARKIVAGLGDREVYPTLEIGPGMGVLTDFLLAENPDQTWVVDIDRESIAYLKSNYPELDSRIIEGDFLKLNLVDLLGDNFLLIGNLPYNISSQIFFRLLELRHHIPAMVCMIQKEVADRIVSPPGNKTYGILSVLLQAYYDIDYLLTVKPGAFNPPPKVNSSVIRLKRNQTSKLDCNEALFFRVVKQGFQNRRKTLRNALKPLNLPDKINQEASLNLRAEQLGVAQFVELTKIIEAGWSQT
jgi:16S rRNA (adenine1518-N6/adenine1519-N6)-dimethyltransferase